MLIDSQISGKNQPSLYKLLRKTRKSSKKDTGTDGASQVSDGSMIKIERNALIYFVNYR